MGGIKFPSFSFRDIINPQAATADVFGSIAEGLGGDKEFAHNSIDPLGAGSEAARNYSGAGTLGSYLAFFGNPGDKFYMRDYGKYYKDKAKAEAAAATQGGGGMDFSAFEKPEWKGMQDSGLQLERFSGNTDVQMTPEELRTIALVDSMITGKYGNFKKSLSGEPDWGQLYQGVILPQRNNLTNNVLPGIADAYSGGPYGAGYNTGARSAAQGKAMFDQSQNEAGLRYQETQNAYNRMAQSTQLLPSMMGIEDIQRQNDIQNMERALKTHYLNQGLTAQEWQADMNYTQAAMGVDVSNAALELEQQKFQYAQQQDALNLQAQRDALNRQQTSGALSGILGTAGGLIGSYYGPVGGMVGSAIGSGLGNMLGGSNAAGSQQINQGVQGYYSQLAMADLLKQYGGTRPSQPSILDTGYSISGYNTPYSANQGLGYSSIPSYSTAPSSIPSSYYAGYGSF